MRGKFHTNSMGTLVLEPEDGDRVVLPYRLRTHYELVPTDEPHMIELARRNGEDAEEEEVAEIEEVPVISHSYEPLPVTERRLLLALRDQPRNTFPSFTQWMRAAGYKGQAPRTSEGRDRLVEMGYVHKYPRDMDTIYTLTPEGRLAAARAAEEEDRA